MFEEVGPPLTIFLKRSRGRPPGVTDAALRSKRDRILILVEKHWFSLQPAFKKLNAPDDVPAFLRSLASDDEDAVKVFVRRVGTRLVKTQVRESLKELSKEMRSRIAVLIRAISTMAEVNEKRRERLQRIEPVLRMHMTEEQRTRALDEQAVLNQAFERDKVQIRKMERERSARETVLARIEVVQFFRSERYRLNPVRIANALAGLPHIGWRQSAKRCREFPSPVGASTLGMHKALRSVLVTCPKNADLVEHVEKWLRATPPSKCAEVCFLRQKWYYLKRTIASTTEKGKQFGEDRAQAIVEEFLRRVSDASPIDRLFENEERITRKRPKIEI